MGDGENGAMNSYSKLAKYYDGFMNDVDYSSWAQYVSRLICRAFDAAEDAPLSRHIRILECGCGTGNITLPLARMGYEVIAADISEEMLSVAAEKARKAGIRVPFVRMDMTALSAHRRVDAVIACCDCVNYLTSLEHVEAFFASAYSIMKPGGALLFDISSEYKLQTVLGNNAFTDENDNAVYFWQNNYDRQSKLIEMTLEFFIKTEKTRDGESLYARGGEIHIQRAHSAAELVSLLEHVGFARIEVFSAFSFDPPQAESERLQFLAVK